MYDLIKLVSRQRHNTCLLCRFRKVIATEDSKRLSKFQVWKCSVHPNRNRAHRRIFLKGAEVDPPALALQAALLE